MQLGELQSQFQRFTNRNVDVVAISVDPIAHSRLMVKRLGLKFPVLSDQDQTLQRAFGVQNPDTQELALHAVYVVNTQKKVVYRKIAGRRPLSAELLDAIDHARGQYPLGDTAPERGDIPVAYPTNNFQALLEIANSQGLPQGVAREELSDVIQMRQRGELDEATIAYRTFASTRSKTHKEEDLLNVAAWLTQETLQLPDEAILSGQALSKALLNERKLRNSKEVTAEQLKQALRELDQLRGLIRRNASKWRLRAAKATLRGYRELSKAAYST